jgi:hypothetical protein
MELPASLRQTAAEAILLPGGIVISSRSGMRRRVDAVGPSGGGATKLSAWRLRDADLVSKCDNGLGGQDR